jgi:hypothetical protein
VHIEIEKKVNNQKKKIHNLECQKPFVNNNNTQNVEGTQFHPRVVNNSDITFSSILNKQLWTADKGWPSSLGVGLTTPHRKKKNSTLRNVTWGLGLGQMLWNDLSHEKWTQDSEPGISEFCIGQGL